MSDAYIEGAKQGRYIQDTNPDLPDQLQVSHARHCAIECGFIQKPEQEQYIQGYLAGYIEGNQASIASVESATPREGRSEMKDPKMLERITQQIAITNQILQAHEDQLARVRNVIMSSLELEHLSKERAQGILRDIADILNISLEQSH